MNTATATVTAPTTSRSIGVTPRMLPNSAASKFRVKLRVLLIRATPTAKLAVVTMPIAASAPMRRRRATALMSNADDEPPEPGPQVEVDRRDVGDDGPAEHRVRQAMADVAHVPQHDVDADQPAQRAHQHRDQRGPGGRTRSPSGSVRRGSSATGWVGCRAGERWRDRRRGVARSSRARGGRARSRRGDGAGLAQRCGAASATSTHRPGARCAGRPRRCALRTRA